MSIYFYLIIFFITLASCKAKVTENKKTENCLSYETRNVQLIGQIFRKSFPGPPNYQDIKKGDEEEIYWLIKTITPFCVNESEMMFGDKVDNQFEAQLVMSSAFNFYQMRRALLGQKVIVKGTLFPQHTGHHKTRVLINVESLEKDND